jgi:hypothetical protein
MATWWSGWKCEGCKGLSKSPQPWNCPGCGKEICDNCGWAMAHCKACAGDKTDEELRLAANATGNFDFEPFESEVKPRLTGS